MKLCIALIFILSHGYGATITATSCSRADVVTAINSASDGDTVVLPTGDSTWTSDLTITKAITLQGQGTSSTFIRRNGNLLTLSPANDLIMRVTGIYFDLGSFYQAGDRWAIFTGATISNLRVDHCYFRGGSRTLFYDAKTYGVTDHCTFKNSDSAINPFMEGSDGGDTSWSNSVQPGTVNTMFVEDCTFIYDTGVTADPNETLYGQNGARCCFRHNSVDATAMTAHPYVAIDAHGYDPGWGHGTRFYEIYSNTFHCHSTYRFCFLRGGTMIVHDNTFTEDANDGPDIIDLTNEGDNQYGTPSTNDVIVNSHFYSNTFNGNSINPVVDAGATNDVILNTNFWNRTFQSGDTYYPYSTYTYPHPRVTGGY